MDGILDFWIFWIFLGDVRVMLGIAFSAAN
jgi:hypothetical protein